MSDTDVDFARLFKDVSRTTPCEYPGHNDETNGCLLRYTSATWGLRQLEHNHELFPVCVGFAAHFKTLMNSTITCMICGARGPVWAQFQLIPLNLPSVIDER